jgi:hypothetical protein
MLGSGGLGDQLGAHLAADSACWAYLTLYRDEAAPGLAPATRRSSPAWHRCWRPDPGEPGTIIVDRDLKLVTATSHAWRWIARLGLAKPSDAEPLPGFIYAMLARLAHAAQPDQTAQVRLQAADGTPGRWYAWHR